MATGEPAPVVKKDTDMDMNDCDFMKRLKGLTGAGTLGSIEPESQQIKNNKSLHIPVIQAIHAAMHIVAQLKSTFHWEQQQKPLGRDTIEKQMPLLNVACIKCNFTEEQLNTLINLEINNLGFVKPKLEEFIMKTSYYQNEQVSTFELF